jgi:hypothetical protein
MPSGTVPLRTVLKEACSFMAAKQLSLLAIAKTEPVKWEKGKGKREKGGGEIDRTGSMRARLTPA